MVMPLEGAMKAKLNIIISGGTGVGKTTLLNTLELHLERRPHCDDRRRGRNCSCSKITSRLETRLANIEGKGQIKATDLV
jgi:pilus assembly protein CpaF